MKVYCLIESDNEINGLMIYNELVSIHLTLQGALDKRIQVIENVCKEFPHLNKTDLEVQFKISAMEVLP